MADYPTIDPRPFGRTYSAPNAITRLPVDLLRTALVTRRPEQTAEAMSQYRQAVTAPEYVPPMNLPQRMLFQQHKSAYNGGIHRPGQREAISSAATLSRALQPTMVDGTMHGVRGLSAVPTVALRRPERVPTYAEAVAANARGAQAFPQPEVAPPPGNLGVRVRPVRQPIAPPLQAFGDSLAEAQQMRAAEAAFRTSNAMRSVEATRESFRKILGF